MMPFIVHFLVYSSNLSYPLTNEQVTIVETVLRTVIAEVVLRHQANVVAQRYSDAKTGTGTLVTSVTSASLLFFESASLSSSRTISSETSLGETLARRSVARRWSRRERYSVSIAKDTGRQMVSIARSTESMAGKRTHAEVDTCRRDVSLEDAADRYQETQQPRASSQLTEVVQLGGR